MNMMVTGVSDVIVGRMMMTMTTIATPVRGPTPRPLGP